MGQASTWAVSAVALIFLQCVSSYKLVCYFTSWSQYRKSQGRFITDAIDPQVCTHLIYAYANVKDGRLVPTEWNDATTYQNLNSLKTKNPSLKTLLSLGGANFDPELFRSIARSPASRSKFAGSVVQLLRDNHFDGFDLAWHTSDENDRTLLATLVQVSGLLRPDDGQCEVVPSWSNQAALGGLEGCQYSDLSERFQHDKKTSGKNKYILSVAVLAGRESIDKGFDIPTISRYADFLNFLTFDFHGFWEHHTGHLSPLYKGKSDTGAASDYNVDYAVKYLKSKDAPAEKIIMGIPTYAGTFTLSTTQTSVGAPASGGGTPGPFTNQTGILAHYEVCDFNSGATMEWITEQEVPYSHKGNQWVGYEDERSIQKKVQYMKNEKLGGIMIWALDLDDFSGSSCNKGKYPLVGAVKQELDKQKPT